MSTNISIIIATRNRATMLVRALKSSLVPTVSSLEVIVVDDASIDSTSDMVYGFNDERIRYIRRDLVGGPAGARNTGIREAKGKVIAFLDDDDEMLPNYIDKISIAFNEPHIDFAWGSWRIIRDEGDSELILRDKHYRSEFRNPVEARKWFLRTLPGGTGGLAVRRDVLLAVGLLDESLSAAVDTELLIRLGQSYHFQVIPDIIYKVHQHSSGQVTTPSPSRAASYERIVQKHAEHFRKYPGMASKLILLAAGTYINCHEYPHAMQSIRRSIMIAPWSLFVWKRCLALIYALFKSR